MCVGAMGRFGIGQVSTSLSLPYCFSFSHYQGLNCQQCPDVRFGLKHLSVHACGWSDMWTISESIVFYYAFSILNVFINLLLYSSPKTSRNHVFIFWNLKHFSFLKKKIKYALLCCIYFVHNHLSCFIYFCYLSIIIDIHQFDAILSCHLNHKEKTN